MRLSLPGEYLTLDPAVSHSTVDEQLENATCAGLLAYPDAAGMAGMRLQPEVAAAMPRVSAGGRTYTFRIRSGFRFSPPSNEPVTAATFKRTLERAFSPKIGHGGQGPFEAPAIAGLAPFVAGKAAHVSGIRARGDTLSITLVEPSGDFLTRISLPHLCPVPSTVPFRPMPPIARCRRPGPTTSRRPPTGGSCCCRTRATAASGRGGGRGSSTRSTSPRRTPWRSSIAARSTTCRSTSTATRCSGATACSSDRYGPGSPAARRGGQRYFLTTGSVPRLHRPERPTPALPQT